MVRSRSPAPASLARRSRIVGLAAELPLRRPDLDSTRWYRHVHLPVGAGRGSLIASGLRSKLSRPKKTFELTCGERRGVEETLRLLALFVDQKRRLRFGFHPFSNHDKVEIMRHGDQ